MSKQTSWDKIFFLSSTSETAVEENSSDKVDTSIINEDPMNNPDNVKREEATIKKWDLRNKMVDQEIELRSILELTLLFDQELSGVRLRPEELS